MWGAQQMGKVALFMAHFFVRLTLAPDAKGYAYYNNTLHFAKAKYLTPNNVRNSSTWSFGP